MQMVSGAVGSLRFRVWRFRVRGLGFLGFGCSKPPGEIPAALPPETTATQPRCNKGFRVAYSLHCSSF